jgi:hypothetical protein
MVCRETPHLLHWQILNIVTSIEVDEYESMRIRSNPYLKKTIVFFFETRNILELRGLGEFAFGIVAPPMITTSKDKGGARRLPSHCVCSMSADVMETTDHGIFPENQKEWEARDGEGQIISRFTETRHMCYAKPCLIPCQCM